MSGLDWDDALMGAGLLVILATSIQWFVAAWKLKIVRTGNDNQVLVSEGYGEALKLLITKLPAQVITGLLLIVLGIVVRMNEWPYG